MQSFYFVISSRKIWDYLFSKINNRKKKTRALSSKVAKRVWEMVKSDLNERKKLQKAGFTDFIFSYKTSIKKKLFKSEEGR